MCSKKQSAVGEERGSFWFASHTFLKSQFFHYIQPRRLHLNSLALYTDRNGPSKAFVGSPSSFLILLWDWRPYSLKSRKSRYVSKHSSIIRLQNTKNHPEAFWNASPQAPSHNLTCAPIANTCQGPKLPRALFPKSMEIYKLKVFRSFHPTCNLRFQKLHLQFKKNFTCWANMHKVHIALPWRIWVSEKFLRIYPCYQMIN